MPEFLNKKKKLENFDLEILSGDSNESPAFVIHLRDLLQREFREIYQDRDNDIFESMQDIVLDWSGLTLNHWNTLVKDGNKISGSNELEIEFSEDALKYLIENTWPQDFLDLIYQTLLEKYNEKEEHDEYIRDEIIAYIHATYRSKAPKDCKGCERMMGGQEQCFFNFQWQVPECPYERLNREPEVIKLYSFCTKAMDSWDKHDEEGFTKPAARDVRGGPVVKEIKKKEKAYGISIEKFEWACRIYQVDEADALGALSWVSVAVQAANEAGELELKKLRKERFPGLRDDD